jgi:hypothetical protein
MFLAAKAKLMRGERIRARRELTEPPKLFGSRTNPARK